MGRPSFKTELDFVGQDVLRPALRLQDGVEEVVNSVEVWKVDDAGLVVHIRAFFDQPTDIELDPYFQPDT